MISKELELGSWVEITKSNRQKFISSGGVISQSAMIAKNVMFCLPVHISPQSQIKEGAKIDKFSFVNWSCVIYSNVYLGSFCSIGRGVEIGLAKHPIEWLSTHTFQYNNGWFPEVKEYAWKKNKRWLHHPPTNIGSDVWIGAGAKIMSGINIGHGAVIAAGAIVVKDVKPYSIVAGVPAKPIRDRFDEDIKQRLLSTKWWNLPLDFIKTLEFDDIENCMKQIETYTLKNK